MKRISLATVLLLFGVYFCLSAQQLTADQILDRVEEKGFLSAEVASMVATVRLDLVEEGETISYTFRVFFKRGEGDEPDKALMVYLEPDLVSGTMFLSWKPKDGDTRMWLYLPDLGIVKELVAEAREQEFVTGSGITYEDLAQGFKYRDDYQAELAGEEEVDGLACYVIELTPKPGHETEYSRIVLWVEKEHFNVIKMESYSGDELVKTMVASELREDELGFIPHRFEFQDLGEGTSSTVALVSRSTAEVPEEYFYPEKLPTLKIEGL